MMIRNTTIRDQVSFASDLAPLKVPAFLVIDALQHSAPSVQLRALALTLAAMCRPLGIDPHDLVTKANRQLVHADAVRNPHIEAIADYAAGELS